MRNQFGLSLVELMISITLGLILMAGVVQMFVSSNRVFGTQQEMSRAQESGRLGVEFIGRDLRMSSFSGCRNTVIEQGSSKIEDPLTQPPGNGAGLIGLHRNFTEGLHGYSVSTAGTTDLPNGVATDLGTGFTVAKNSDIIVIRGANERGMVVNATNIETAVYGHSDQAVVSSCIEGFCNGGVAVVSNCRNGRVFKLNAAPTLAGNTVTLTHADSWDLAPPSIDVYSPGSEVVPIHTVVYFVATSSTPVGNTTPGLWQKTDNEPAVEVLRGVERLGAMYMVKPSSAQPLPPYELAADVDFWDLVSAVQVEIVSRGDKPFELDSPQSYSFRNATITPTDRYMRKVFKATFSLRSRNP